MSLNNPKLNPSPSPVAAGNGGEPLPKRLIILRGAPGSGKSHLAKELSNSIPLTRSRILSSDDFFIQSDSGIYVFDPSKIREAHAWNQERSLSALNEGIPLVIIDNTHMQAWEAYHYVKMAQDHGYWIEFREPATKWWIERDTATLVRMNTHGVTEDKIKIMISRYQPDFNVEMILLTNGMPPRMPRREEGRGIRSQNTKNNRFDQENRTSTGAESDNWRRKSPPQS